MVWRAAKLGALAAMFAAAPAFSQFTTPDDQPSQAPRTPPPPPPAEALMTTEDLRDEFSGASYEGCYPDGSAWAERTAADGVLYDLLRDGAAVGSWWVEDRQICYYYDAQDVTACWNAIKQNGNYYFFFPGTGLLGGTTDCGVPIA